MIVRPRFYRIVLVKYLWFEFYVQRLLKNYIVSYILFIELAPKVQIPPIKMYDVNKTREEDLTMDKQVYLSICSKYF